MANASGERRKKLSFCGLTTSFCELELVETNNSHNKIKAGDCLSFMSTPPKKRRAGKCNSVNVIDEGSLLRKCH